MGRPARKKAEPKAPIKPARQPVTIHYRRLEDATGAFGRLSLETAIRKAMNHAGGDGKVSEHWKLRAMLVPPGSEDTYLMNVIGPHWVVQIEC